MLKKTLIIITVLGLFISLYLFYEKMVGGDLICGISSCDVVNNSSYSEIYSIPISFFGVIYYLSMITILFLKKYKLFFIFSIVGLSFSLYLTYLEAFVILAWCQWCVTSALIVLGQFAISLKLFKYHQQQ